MLATEIPLCFGPSKPSKDRSGPPKAFENPDNIAAANPQSPRLPLCLLEYGVGRLDAARCGFQFALAQPGEFPQPTKQLTVSRFAPPQQARLYVIEIPDERATGNNHNTMRKKARLLPFHLLPLCSDVLLRSKAADCPAAWGILHAASHVMLMPQLRHGPALPLDGRIRCEEKTDAFPNRASTFLRESIRRICSYRLTSPSIRLTEFVHDNMRNFAGPRCTSYPLSFRSSPTYTSF
ncbi:hypothetical protein CCUS01_13599 [Colletotrichum cuscutae]|uniref:Uncharacterized protein n=1 Tax=Colletotrichum cuscutae TaxID=1209917 RepID=A0AAI9YBB6_9PEZI|nr:hypothetical protein CCUS01_13599 [Colletotrichum cuscutae]